MPVMRRQSDGWVNATHILKVASFDKPQRTRILEREVQTGTHEKVQGGYGKFQGTWVPLERAKDLAQRFGVFEQLEPLFEYTASNVPPPAAPKHPWRPRGNAKSSSVSELNNLPIAKKRRVGSATRAESSTYPSNNSNVNAVDMGLVPRSLTISEDASRYAGGDHTTDSRGSHGYNGRAPAAHDEGGLDSESDGAFDTSDDEALDVVDESYSAKLLDYFIRAGEQTTEVPDFLVNPPRGFDVNNVIDDEGHTAFHWACAMGDLQIVDVLLSIGADIAAVNRDGETPLIRAVTFTNNYDRNTFPRLVEILHDTMFYEDQNKRTVLHHIAATTSSKSKLKAAKYYLETLLGTLGGQPLDSFINKADSPGGDTALHITARNGAVKCNRILLQYGANPLLRNNSGRTSQEYMSEHETHKQQQHQHQPQQMAYAHSYGNGLENKMQTPPPPLASTKLSTPSGNQSTTNLNYSTQQNGPVIPSTETAIVPLAGAVAQPTASMTLNGAEKPDKIMNKLRPKVTKILAELSSTFSMELKEKDTDLEQMTQLLDKVNADITSTRDEIERQEQKLGIQSQTEHTLQKLTTETDSKFEKLRCLIERSQSRDLARLVEKEESKLEIKQENMENDEAKIEEANSELTTLQLERKELVEEILKLYANAGAGSRMSDYRQLLSMSCGIGLEEIDDLIDGISQALIEGTVFS